MLAAISGRIKACGYMFAGITIEFWLRFTQGLVFLIEGMLAPLSN
jgi:hypothetical protein